MVYGTLAFSPVFILSPKIIIEKQYSPYISGLENKSLFGF
jgi:hypothetical protein